VRQLHTAEEPCPQPHGTPAYYGTQRSRSPQKSRLAGRNSAYIHNGASTASLVDAADCSPHMELCLQSLKDPATERKEQLRMGNV